MGLYVVVHVLLDPPYLLLLVFVVIDDRQRLYATPGLSAPAAAGCAKGRAHLAVGSAAAAAARAPAGCAVVSVLCAGDPDSGPAACQSKGRGRECTRAWRIIERCWPSLRPRLRLLPPPDAELREDEDLCLREEDEPPPLRLPGLEERRPRLRRLRSSDTARLDRRPLLWLCLCDRLLRPSSLDTSSSKSGDGVRRERAGRWLRRRLLLSRRSLRPRRWTRRRSPPSLLPSSPPADAPDASGKMRKDPAPSSASASASSLSVVAHACSAGRLAVVPPPPAASCVACPHTGAPSASQLS